MKRHDWTALALIGASGLSGLALTSRMLHNPGESPRVEIVRIEIEGTDVEAVPEATYEAPWKASWVPYKRWAPASRRTVIFRGEFPLELKAGEVPIRFSGPGARKLGPKGEPTLWEGPSVRFPPIR